MEELTSLADLLDLQQVDSQIDRLIEQRQNLHSMSTEVPTSRCAALSPKARPPQSK